jgi:glycosyltransferase involved in cell wall biosynthesis
VHLAKAGHEVAIFTDAFNFKLFPIATRYSIRVITPNPPSKPFVVPSFGIHLAQRRMLDCGHNLQQLLENFKPDVTISHNFPAEILCRFGQWRHIHFCHEPPYQLFGHITQPGFVREANHVTKLLLSLWREMDRRAVRLVQRIFANSNFTSSLVKKCYSREARVLSPGIDTSIFRPVSYRNLKEKLGLDGFRVILTCSRIHKIKGVEDFLLMLRRLRRNYPDSVGVVIGSGPEEINLWRLARQLRISDHVLFLRSIPQYRDDLAPFYCAADVVVYASHFEPLGLVPLEAMACERPVVAYSFGGPAETIENEVTGLLAQPGSVSDLSNCVARILGDPDMGRRMGEDGRRRVQSQFSWKTHVETIDSEALA